MFVLVTVLSFAVSLGYQTPICRAHEGSVYSFCNGSPFRAWGVGAEGVEQAIKNCQWKANSQHCLREATVSLDPFTNRSIGEGASATIDRKQWFGGHWNIYKGGIQWRDEDIGSFPWPLSCTSRPILLRVISYECVRGGSRVLASSTCPHSSRLVLTH